MLARSLNDCFYPARVRQTASISEAGDYETKQNPLPCFLKLSQKGGWVTGVAYSVVRVNK